MSKTKLTTWVSDAVAHAIRSQAALAELTVSEYLRVRLHEIVEDHRATLSMQIVEARLENAVRESVLRMSDRLNHVLARAAIEAATARRNSSDLMQANFPLDAKQRVYDNWRKSAESLKKPIKELSEVLEPAGEG